MSHLYKWDMTHASSRTAPAGYRNLLDDPEQPRRREHGDDNGEDRGYPRRACYLAPCREADGLLPLAHEPLDRVDDLGAHFVRISRTKSGTRPVAAVDHADALVAGREANVPAEPEHLELRFGHRSVDC